MATKSSNSTASTVANDAAARVSAFTSGAANAVSGLFSALTTAGRRSVEGMIEVDKALLGAAGTMISNTVDLGRATLQAKSLDEVIELQSAYANKQIDVSAAKARDVVEMVRSNVREVYAPLNDVAERYSPRKAA